uniref:Uncharacterized protein n=1 Tax=Panagrolaimus sp. PS1159 TaxID=55785 RepID=A0AC35EYL4_9BILA
MEEPSKIKDEGNKKIFEPCLVCGTLTTGVHFQGNKKIFEPCLVCGTSTTGVHFQVNCCRACSAFFRRSVRSKISYRCQRGVGSCDVTIRSIGKAPCRFCRLKKCVQVGMRIQKDEKEKGIEEKTTNALTPINSNNNRDVTRVGKVHEKIKMRKGLAIAVEANINLTKSFGESLSKLLEFSKPKAPLSVLTDFSDEKKNEHFEIFLIKIAEMLSQFEYFAALEVEEKFLLFKRFWQIFHILERCYQSALHFGDSDLDDTRVCIGSEYYVNLSTASKSFLSDERRQDGNIFVLPFFDKLLLLLRPFKKASITLFEFAYICQITLWSCYDIVELNLSTQKLAEDLIGRVSGDLHEYFVREMRMVNYAARQAELFRLVQIAEYIARDKKQLIAANQIFKFVEHDFSFATSL